LKLRQAIVKEKELKERVDKYEFLYDEGGHSKGVPIKKKDPQEVLQDLLQQREVR